LANLFVHCGFGAWMAREFPGCPFKGYADGAVVHCPTEGRDRRAARSSWLWARYRRLWALKHCKGHGKRYGPESQRPATLAIGAEIPNKSCRVHHTADSAEGGRRRVSTEVFSATFR
jgi:hypothetical protein